jgi:hypothetical protein
MATTLTVAQLQDLGTEINNGSLTLDQFYQQMASYGYQYASLADGVVNQNTFSGAEAVNFMTASAAQQGITLTNAQISSLETAMAIGWLNEMQTVAGQNGGSISSDLNFAQTEAFHTQVFSESGLGLGPQTWTLYTPGQLLTPQASQSLWENILSGSNTTVNIELLATMAACAELCTSQQSQAAAQNWLNLVGGTTGTSTGSQIDNALSNFFIYLENSNGLGSQVNGYLDGVQLNTIDSNSITLGQNVNLQNLATLLTNAIIPSSSTTSSSANITTWAALRRMHQAMLLTARRYTINCYRCCKGCKARETLQQRIW